MTWRHGGDGVLVIVALIALGRLIAFQLSCQVQPTEGCNCNCNCNISTKATTSTSKRHLTSARVPCECLADESCSSAAHSHCKVIQEKKKKKLHYISALTSWRCGVCVCVCLCLRLQWICICIVHIFNDIALLYWFYTPRKYLLNHVANFIVQLARALQLVLVTSICCRNRIEFVENIIDFIVN